MHFWERLAGAGVDLKLQRDLFAPFAAEMDAALECRDAAGAAEIAYSLMKLHRERTLKILTQEHAKEGKVASENRSRLPVLDHFLNQRPRET